MNSKLIKKISWLAGMAIVAVGIVVFALTAQPYFNDIIQKLTGKVEFNTDAVSLTNESVNEESRVSGETKEVEEARIVTAEEAMNSVSIPTIGLKNIPVIYPKVNDYETIESALADGVVHLSNTSLPDANTGATYIIGHSSNLSWAKGDYNYVFKDLSNLEAGNTIKVNYGRERYDYVVIEKRFLNFDEAINMKFDSSKKVLVLMTCWPANSSRARIAIIAETKAKQSF